MGRHGVLYEELQSSSAQIRLIRLRRDDTNWSGQVSGELTTFSLDDPCCPPFTTVSYTWGDGKEYGDKPIQLSGYDTFVLKNVLALLRMLCSTSSDEFNLAEDWFWIDSICINQDNLGERSSQVKLMGQIYRQAKATIVWLCEASDDTNTAIELLLHLANRRHELRRNYKKRGKLMPADLSDHPGWKPLESLLELPWWRRVWTLQEFLLAKDLTFYCGAQCISRRLFRKGLHALELCGPLECYIKTPAWTTAWNRRRLIQWYEHDQNRHKMSLVSLMAFCGDYETTDPKDRIWAVHGLAREEDRQMIGRPTYCYDERTLYTGLVQAFLYQYKSLDIICFAQLFQSPEEDWPSWVPDWRLPCPPYVVPLMVSQSANDALANFRPINRSPKAIKKRMGMSAYRASADESPVVDLGDMFNHLTCRGIVIDSIDGLGGIPAQDDRLVRGTASTSPVNTTTANADHKEELCNKLVRSLVLNRHDKYLESRAPVPQYGRELRQLVEFVDSGGEPGDLRPAWFLGWWKLNNDLSIRGFSVQEICQTRSASLHAPTAGEPVPKHSKSFFSRIRGVMAGKTRRLMVTKEGFLGVAPRRAQKEDIVCVLYGCSVPVVLRKCDTSDESANLCEFVGECYMDGMMDGEALALGREVQDFKIQ
ncbi:heterokaryon incompatibility protein-domain-containing protein [Diaporthe sp. PMI_573]|nr:heterokaryon incompatibility protein-domain-containing protein [Diaporthaceae sp. PMI_573]